MNHRERYLAIILLTLLVLLAGGFGVFKFLIEPMRDRAASIALLRQEIEKKKVEIAKVEAEKVKLAHWRQISLPADVDLASREYEKYLGELLRQSKFTPGSISVKAAKDSKSTPTLPGPKKEAIYTKLTYAVTIQGDLASLVTFLDRFYHTGLLHQIKKLAIQRPLTASPGQRPNELDINLTIEALVLQGAENRPYLTPVEQRLLVLDALTALRRGPSGLALVAATAGPAGPWGDRTLATPTRQYGSILGKNIFYGPPPAIVVEQAPPKDTTDVAQFVFLTDITQGDTRTEAFLFDRYHNRKIRLRASAGFDSFLVRDAQGDTLLSGKVLRIEERDILFLAREKYYSLHIGQNLKEALAKPLSESAVKELDLKPAK